MKRLPTILRTCQQAYRIAGIQQAYKQLALDEILAEPKEWQDISALLCVHEDALLRFLRALCFIGMVEEVSYGQFRHVKQMNDSDEPSMLLFWMINDSVERHLKNSEFIVNNKERLARCASIGLLQYVNGEYALADGMQTYFSPVSDDYLEPLVQHHQHIMIHFFKPDIIIRALKTNQSQWEAAIGKVGISSAFDAYEDQQLLRTFMVGMHMLTSAENSLLAKEIDLSGVNHMLDVGGGSGDWISKLLLLSSNRDCSGYIYELPEAIPLLDSIRQERTDPEIQKRITYIGGSFLNVVDHSGLESISEDKRFDLICLCWVLHDWSDETCVSILQKIYYHLPDQGRLVILEAILPDNRIGPPCIHDITMLLQTEGRERTIGDYQNLLARAGFSDSHAGQLEIATQRQVVIAIK